MRFRPAMLASAVLAAAACTENTAAPTAVRAPAAGSRSAMESGTGSLARQGAGYIVAYNGAGAFEKLAAVADRLGGTVTFRHDGAGFAVISGMPDSSGSQLAAVTGVTDVALDAAVSLREPAAAVRPDVSSVLSAINGVSINSASNPATAILYGWQWDMRSIHANQAWALGKLGSKDVTVAIIDSGIDYDDLDLNGLVDLSRSRSFVPSDDSILAKYFPTRNAISDLNGHGTNVAAQASSKAVAFAGVTSRTTLIGVKVIGASGVGSEGATLSGVLWAADHGANVANLSLGGTFAKAGDGLDVSITNRVFNYARQKGMLIVVSAGNDAADLDHNGNDEVAYCDAPHVICVSSVGPTSWNPTLPDPTSPDTPAYYSNVGRSAISVAAPGGNAQPLGDGKFVVSDWPWGRDIASWVWSLCSKTTITSVSKDGVPSFACAAGNLITAYIGTSQAAPHVAGLAALLLAEQGHGQPSQIKNAIEKSADDLGQIGTDPFYGKGRINVARAIQ
ncbi:MAG TPA: S8 family serine peptidase [Gemmatimonadaceae bacterium]|nr:S8 family serine peptidase [Gemmatimonadaceae bacterium]